MPLFEQASKEVYIAPPLPPPDREFRATWELQAICEMVELPLSMMKQDLSHNAVKVVQPIEKVVYIKPATKLFNPRRYLTQAERAELGRTLETISYEILTMIMYTLNPTDLVCLALTCSKLYKTLSGIFKGPFGVTLVEFCSYSPSYYSYSLYGHELFHVPDLWCKHQKDDNLEHAPCFLHKRLQNFITKADKQSKNPRRICFRCGTFSHHNLATKQCHCIDHAVLQIPTRSTFVDSVPLLNESARTFLHRVTHKLKPRKKFLVRKKTYWEIAPMADGMSQGR